MDLRFEVYQVDWFRMTSFYLTFTLEYLISVLLVIKTIPFLRNEPKTWNIRSLNIKFDYAFVLIFYLCASFPYFLNTIVYLHRKRQQMLKLAQ
jgi:hypothetical protein